MAALFWEDRGYRAAIASSTLPPWPARTGIGQYSATTFLRRGCGDGAPGDAIDAIDAAPAPAPALGDPGPRRPPAPPARRRRGEKGPSRLVGGASGGGGGGGHSSPVIRSTSTRLGSSKRSRASRSLVCMGAPRPRPLGADAA